nr:hypothetical protein [uncultured Mucilaginibacter sp.]
MFTTINKWSEQIPNAIAIIPAVAYFSAYLFERSYCLQFGLPLEYITISFSKVLDMSVFLIIFFGVLFTLPTDDLFPKPGSVWIAKYDGYFIIAPVFSIVIISVIFIIGALSAIISLGLVVLCCCFLVFIYRENKRLWKESCRLIKVMEEDNIGMSEVEIAEAVALKLGLDSQKDYKSKDSFRRIGFIVFVCLSFMFFSVLTGKGVAHQQRSFFEITTHKGLLIVRKYDDILLCKIFNAEEGKWMDSIVTINATTKDLQLKEIIVKRD